ncbi:MAG: hypothetical protein IAI49_12320, partial [Candidatus Eremiobacteraeota bacterium]|nr:hypothetical protein [Candidatus Eremiobacteraeota bacterium]
MMSIPGKRFLRFSSIAIGALVTGLAACSGQSGQPVAPILTSANPTQTPRTSPVTPAPTATPKATATPTTKPTATPTPKASPTAVAVSGAQAACVLTLGSNTYAFVPGTIASPAVDANTVGLAEVKVSSGAGILSRTRPTIRSARIAPNTQGPRPRAARSRGLHSFDVGAGGNTILPLTPAPQECAADVAHSDLYIINYLSPTINVVHVDPATAAMSLLATYTTDASSLIGFSGGSAEILGVAWDTKDNGLIVAT